MICDVFISCIQPDAEEYASSLSEKLQEKDFVVFKDDLESILGLPFNPENSMINRCEFVIVLLSRDFFSKITKRANAFTRKAIAYAIEQHKNIISIMLPSFNGFPSWIPDDLQTLRHANCLRCYAGHWKEVPDKLLPLLTSLPSATEKDLHISEKEGKTEGTELNNDNKIFLTDQKTDKELFNTLIKAAEAETDSEEKPKACDGDRPYIFISYCHEDEERVIRFIAALQKKYNVWFDEGVHYGHEWEEEIAAKLRGCSLFLFMITQSSFKSVNCKDELYRARDLDKPFINVIVDDGIGEFPEWFSLRYKRYQMCKLYSFRTDDEAVRDLARKNEAFEKVKK